jgi:hypothetical protein
MGRTGGGALGTSNYRVDGMDGHFGMGCMQQNSGTEYILISYWDVVSRRHGRYLGTCSQAR